MASDTFIRTVPSSPSQLATMDLTLTSFELATEAQSTDQHDVIPEIVKEDYFTLINPHAHVLPGQLKNVTQQLVQMQRHVIPRISQISGYHDVTDFVAVAIRTEEFIPFLKTQWNLGYQVGINVERERQQLELKETNSSILKEVNTILQTKAGVALLAGGSAGAYNRSHREIFLEPPAKRSRPRGVPLAMQSFAFRELMAAEIYTFVEHTQE